MPYCRHMCKYLNSACKHKHANAYVHVSSRVFVHYQCLILSKYKEMIVVCLLLHSLLDRSSRMWRPCMTMKQTKMVTLVSDWETRLKSSKTVSGSVQPLCIVCHITYWAHEPVRVSVCSEPPYPSLGQTLGCTYIQGAYVRTYMAMSVVQPSGPPPSEDNNRYLEHQRCRVNTVGVTTYNTWLPKCALSVSVYIHTVSMIQCLCTYMPQGDPLAVSCNIESMHVTVCMYVYCVDQINIRTYIVICTYVCAETKLAKWHCKIALFLFSTHLRIYCVWMYCVFPSCVWCSGPRLVCRDCAGRIRNFPQVICEGIIKRFPTQLFHIFSFKKLTFPIIVLSLQQ